MLILLFIFAILAPPQDQSLGQTRIEIDADSQFAYAKSLYLKKRHMLSVVEWERFIHWFPEDSRISEARFHVGMAYYAQRQFESAIQAFKPLMTMEEIRTEYHVRAYFMAAESQQRLGSPSAALTILHNLEIQAKDPAVSDEAVYRSAWIYLNLGDWDRASHVLKKISSQGRVRYRISELSQQIEKNDQIERLSPGLAGTLAIIPGAGYLYCRRYKDALIAFLVNGGLIYAAYEAFENDLVALGSVITFVEIGFYSGNIYGSISSAHKYNRDRQRDFIDRLKNNLQINLSARPQNKGLELSFKYRF